MEEHKQPQNITRFLLQSVRFYENIDDYARTLNLDAAELLVFKNDVRIFLFIAERYQSFTRSFVLYNISIMRTRFEHLSVACINSRNYTKEIGEKLGIDADKNVDQVYFIQEEGPFFNKIAS